MDEISLLGSIASIGGAIVSVYSAIKANKIKNAIIGKLHLNKMSELLTLAKVSIAQINRICLPESKIRGINLNDITTPLLNLQGSVVENKDILKKHNFEELDESITILKEKIKNLKYESNKANWQTIGEELREVVETFISELSRISRSTVEG